MKRTFEIDVNIDSSGQTYVSIREFDPLAYPAEHKYVCDVSLPTSTNSGRALGAMTATILGDRLEALTSEASKPREA